jgi:hypothetical protein
MEVFKVMSAELVRRDGSLTREIDRTVEALVRAYLAVLGHPPAERDDETESQREHIRINIWKVRRLLREAAGAGAHEDLFRALNMLAANGPAIERAVIVWVDLISVLVQDVERRYGAGSGKGALKREEVKATMQYLLRSDRIDIPCVPEFLEPLVIDVLVGWSIDVVVLVSNRHGLWGEVAPRPTPGRRLLTFLATRGRKLVLPLLRPLGWLAGAIHKMGRAEANISPDLKAALEAVEREGLLFKSGDSFLFLGNTLAWIGQHRQSIIASTELVFTAVREAEKFISQSGAQKKAYARDLIFVALNELGFVPRTGLLSAFIDSLISTGIEAAVHMFHKRNAFTHRLS